MRRTVVATIGATVVAAAGLAALSVPSSVADNSAVPARVSGPSGSIALVQAVPDTTMAVTVDGRSVAGALGEGKVLEPVALSVGSHEIVFTPASGDPAVASTVTVRSGHSTDIVIHDPAQVGGDPIVSVYPTPRTVLGPGRARVLFAHTATTAPADVRVDGKTVFRNIANGEFAEADVAAGAHTVSLLPSGYMGAPILGPLTLTLKPGTVTTVYAVGNPRMDSMNAIVRTTTLAGAHMRVMTQMLKAPTAIDTGSAGLVGDRRVTPFAVRG